MVKKGRYKDSLSRNRSMEEIAEDIGLSFGQPREKSKRQLYRISQCRPEPGEDPRGQSE